ncbi:hypothetical protein [Gottfriedia solisilvae]|uniref:Uncharacterized protein n=1 Tax=Gottfriedia solisilvae TaxID=1516104 RepID=A0A8J3ADC9_9BACI|nr:hypothetical protein [Gottfriedia solisilvae]GGI11548.1 hypothetical protein GCM10007380_08390 [Gottfriedia solisilvae]
METIFFIISFLLMPILATIFCVNLVEIMKKIKDDLPIATNSFWLTISFIFIVWPIAVMAAMGV